MSDRVALFQSGRIEQIGTGRDLYEAPASRFVAGFIGNSNFLDGKLSRSENSIVLPDGTALRGLATDKVKPNQDAVSVMVRPDHLRLHGPDDATPRLRGTVKGLTYLGEYTQVAIETAWGAQLSLRLSPDETSRVAPGRAVDLTCRPDDMRVF